MSLSEPRRVLPSAEGGTLACPSFRAFLRQTFLRRREACRCDTTLCPWRCPLSSRHDLRCGRSARGRVSDDAIGFSFGDAGLVARALEFVVLFDEQPVGLAFVGCFAAHANQCPLAL